MEENKSDIEKSLEKLKDSPLFALSLGSKELFHSNFLQWISNIRIDDNPNLGKYLFKKIWEEMGVNFCDNLDFEVLREKNNLDLCVCRKGDKEGKKGYLLVIENKFKSIPSSGQLKQYEAKKGVNSETILILLSFMKDFEDLSSITPRWQVSSYDQLVNAIQEIRKEVDNQYIQDLLKDYCDFTIKLSQITDFFLKQKEFLLPKNEKSLLRNYRIEDLIEKVRASKNAYEISKKIKEENFSINTGYGRSGAMIEIWFPISKEEAKKKEQNALIIQIQGNHYCHGFYNAAKIDQAALPIRFPKFFANNNKTFQKDRNYNYIFSSNSSTEIFCKFKSQNDNPFLYQYCIINQSATITDIYNEILKDINILKQYKEEISEH